MHAALYIGIGQLMQGRREIFKQGTGVAVLLHERVFGIPPFPGTSETSDPHNPAVVRFVRHFSMLER